MVDVPGGYGVSDYSKEAGEMVKRRVPAPLVPNEEPAWTPTDYAIVAASARIEIPMAGVTRAEVRRIGELIQQLGNAMVEMSHRHQMSERSIMFEVCNQVRLTQHVIGPIRRAKRRSHRDE